MTTQSSSYKAIDYAKFIFSILVIALHCGPFECVSADASLLLYAMCYQNRCTIFLCM